MTGRGHARSTDRELLDGRPEIGRTEIWPCSPSSPGGKKLTTARWRNSTRTEVRGRWFVGLRCAGFVSLRSLPSGQIQKLAVADEFTILVLKSPSVAGGLKVFVGCCLQTED